MAIVDAAASERDRWLLWLPVGIAVGVVIYFSLPSEPSLWIAILALGLAVALAMLARRRSSLLLAMAITVAAVALGFGAAKLRTIAASAPVLEGKLGPAAVSGIVVTAEPWENGPRIILAQPKIAGLAPDKTPAKVRVRLLRKEPVPRVGEAVSVRAVLMPPTPPALPGAYDFGRQAFLQGIGAVGYAAGRVRVLESGGAAVGWLTGFNLWVEGLRQSIARGVMAVLPGATGAMSAALINGDQSAIPPDVMDAMRDAGLAHLLAISGFNVALVAGVLFFGARLLLVGAGTAPVWGQANGWALRHPIKKWAAVFTIIGIFAYTLITGASVPTQRAFLMTAVVLTAVLIDRTAISMRLVMWAALVLILVAPESVLGASFQMSFAAVIALIAAYESTRGWVRAQRAKGGFWRKTSLYLGGMVLTTLVAAVATAPFAAFHFNRLARLSADRQLRRRAADRAMDHAVGHPGLFPDAARARGLGAGADELGRRCADLVGADGDGLAQCRDAAALDAGGRPGGDYGRRLVALPVAAALAVRRLAADRARLRHHARRARARCADRRRQRTVRGTRRRRRAGVFRQQRRSGVPAWGLAAPRRRRVAGQGY